MILAMTGQAAWAQIPSSGGPTPTPPPLPVDLLGIAARNAGAHNQVEWTVANEHNLAVYVVERSADGMTFDRMAAVTAAGKSDYSVYDNAPNAGRTYYRLVMTNIDGSSEYSKTVQAFMGVVSEIVLSTSPNPFGPELRIAVSGVQDGQVCLSDVSGRTVIAGVIANGEALIRTGDLPAGPYFLQFRNGTASKTIKVIKR